MSKDKKDTDKEDEKPVKGSFLDIMKAAAKDANKKSKKKEKSKNENNGK